MVIRHIPKEVMIKCSTMGPHLCLDGGRCRYTWRVMRDKHRERRCILLPRVSCNGLVGTEDQCKQTFVEVFKTTQGKAGHTSSIKIQYVWDTYRITYKVSWFYSSSSSDKDSEAFCRSWAFMAPTKSSDSPFWAASRCPRLIGQRYSRSKWNKNQATNEWGCELLLVFFFPALPVFSPSHASNPSSVAWEQYWKHPFFSSSALGNPNSEFRIAYQFLRSPFLIISNNLFGETFHLGFNGILHFNIILGKFLQSSRLGVKIPVFDEGLCNTERGWWVFNEIYEFGIHHTRSHRSLLQPFSFLAQ